MVEGCGVDSSGGCDNIDEDNKEGVASMD